MKKQEALDVFYIAVDRYFADDAKPVDGRVLQRAMDVLASLGEHSVCAPATCRCPLKLRSRKVTPGKPNVVHIRRRQCHA